MEPATAGGRVWEGPPATGTTIVAVAFDGGVVLGADSRVTTGTYISNRASDKVTPLVTDETSWMLRSGSAADTQAVSDYVRHFTSQLSAELGSEPTVKMVANLVKMMNYQNKHLMGALIVAGWDRVAGGQVWGVPIGGALVPQKWATDGSGSTYIWGYLDSAYRDGLTRKEAEDIVTTALALAVNTDGSSGGMARLVTVTEAGAERRLVRGDEVQLFWDGLEAGVGEGLVVV